VLRILDQLETENELDKGALNDPVYKKPLKAVIKETVISASRKDITGEAGADGEPEVVPVTKVSAKRKRKAVNSESEGEDEEALPPARKAQPRKRKTALSKDGEVSESEAGGSRKPVSARKAKAKPKSQERPNITQKSSSKDFKSAEFVDEDGDEPDAEREAATTPKSRKQPSSRRDDHPRSSTSGRTKQTARASTMGNKTDDSAKPRSIRTSVPKATKRSTIEDEDPDTRDSDLELSSVIDDPPNKSKKSKKTGRAETQKRNSGRKSTETLSKDEAKVKRLKGFVLACGVRKVWSKEFKDLERPSQQIARLEQMLRELGMQGRFSLEQAKSIREQRELAQELQDVQAFNKAVSTGRPFRSRGVKGEKKASEEIEIEESDTEVPAKRKTARNMVAAFLADQSDEEMS